jgi:hypothetical protein
VKWAFITFGLAAQHGRLTRESKEIQCTLTGSTDLSAVRKEAEEFFDEDRFEGV